MAMEVDPIDTVTTVVTERPIRPTMIWGDRLSIDASKRDFGAIAVEVSVTPYTDTGVFAALSIVHRTANAVAAAQYVPEIGVAIETIQAAIVSIHREVVRRQATLAAASAAVESAQAAEAELLSARNVAFAARKSVDDPAWIAADLAWEQAKAATVTANDRRAIAQLATDDVANPPL